MLKRIFVTSSSSRRLRLLGNNNGRRGGANNNHQHRLSVPSQRVARLFSSKGGGGGGGGGKDGDDDNDNIPSLEDIIQSFEKTSTTTNKNNNLDDDEDDDDWSSPLSIMEQQKKKKKKPTTSNFAASTTATTTTTGGTTFQPQPPTRPPPAATTSSPNYYTQQHHQQQQTSSSTMKVDIDWSKKEGRGWTDPWNPEILLEASLSSGQRIASYDDLPDWSPQYVSRASQERVHIYPAKIPTLQQLSKLALPPPAASPGNVHPPGLYPGQYVALNPDTGLLDEKAMQEEHTRNKRAYGRHRERHLYSQIQRKVVALAEPQIFPRIVKLQNWDDKQDAIDDLFESIELQLRESEVILGKHPSLGKWVERALEEYLAQLVTGSSTGSSNEDAAKDEFKDDDESNDDDNDKDSDNKNDYPTTQQDEAAVPIFMDCYGATAAAAAAAAAGSSKKTTNNESVTEAAILRPLRPYERAANQGRMMEEWELAAHDQTKRILLRQSTRQVARILLEHADSSSTSEDAAAGAASPRVLVTGRQGVGKTAALASIVAAARQSGHVVWYMPDCNQLHQNGYYIEPNERSVEESSVDGGDDDDDDATNKSLLLFDLPVLSQQVCRDLLASHGNDLQTHDLKASTETLQQFFTAEQLEHVPNSDNGKDIPLSDLLRLGQDKTGMAPMCLSTVIHVLMQEQTAVPFTIVADEFNTLYAPGKYFHGDYDEEVKKAIPYDQITLFRPILQAMGLPHTVKHGRKKKGKFPVVVDDAAVQVDPIPIKNGGAIVAGLTESCAVSRQVTDTLVAHAQHQQDKSGSSLHVVDVPRLSEQEVYSVLANYEAIGLGKLRLDQGETILNAQEVAFLRTVSGNVPQLLMNACIM